MTGISGYLGANLASRLRLRNDIGDIAGIDIRDSKILPQGISFYQKDIRAKDIIELLSLHRIDTLFHLAFVVKPIRNLRHMHDIDVVGTKNILQSAFNAGVKHVIAISSTLAYGAHPDNPNLLDEEAPLRGNKSFPYGHYKAVTDRIIQDFAADHPEMIITILRPCTVFGPNVDNYISRMLFLPVTICVKGHNPSVQFVHEDDFVEACVTVMDKKIPGPFNINGDGVLTVNRIAELLGTRLIPVPAWLLYPMVELLWRLHFPGIEVNRGYLDYIRYPFVASNKNAKKKFGFKPRFTSTQTVIQTLEGKGRGNG
jgi:UDP-glucose 4-epimerase